jgi:hypothetical protein
MEWITENFWTFMLLIMSAVGCGGLLLLAFLERSEKMSRLARAQLHSLLGDRRLNRRTNCHENSRSRPDGWPGWLYGESLAEQPNPPRQDASLSESFLGG